MPTTGYGIDIDTKRKGISDGYGVDVLLVPQSAPQGRQNPVKMAMLLIIASADVKLQPQNVHVRGDWKIANYLTSENYPIVTVRMGNVDMTEKVYGRLIGGQMRGHYVTYAFSAHVWGEKSTQLFDETMNDTIPQAQPASDITDEIIDVLEQYIGDDVSGICWFYEVKARESEPDRGPQRLTRFIIEGYVTARRPFGTFTP